MALIITALVAAIVGAFSGLAALGTNAMLSAQDAGQAQIDSIHYSSSIQTRLLEAVFPTHEIYTPIPVWSAFAGFMVGMGALYILFLVLRFARALLG